MKMMFSHSELIALCSLGVAFIALLLNSRKGTREEASQITKVGVQLNSIQTGVDDIRLELRSVRTRLDNIAERVSACEAKIKTLEGR